ncbi:MAG: ABC transporter ATP-binding protein [bacterium]
MEIIAKNLIKKYGSKIVVDEVSLTIEPGKIIGLLGPNGAGKSTTIKMLTGQIKPDAGSLEINGEAHTYFPEELRVKLGIMPQDVVIWDSLNILENLQMAADLYELKPKFAKGRIEYLIKALKLEPELKTLARDLSGGYKRRLNLAISIIHDPEIIFLDEPTPGIDVQSRHLLMSFVKQLADSGDHAIVLTDHYLDEVEKLCDYIIIIDGGEIIAEGTLKKLKSKYGEGNLMKIDLNPDDSLQYQSAKANTGLLDDFKQMTVLLQKEFPTGKINAGIFSVLTKDMLGELQRAVALLNKQNYPVHNIALSDPSLEDIFLLLTGKEVRE